MDADFEPVAKFDAIPDEGTLEVGRADGTRVCLIRRGNEVTAVSATCTHQEFPMAFGDVLHDGTIQCAWHGAKFDCKTGQVRQIPATEPLPIYHVKIEGDIVLLGGITEKRNDRYESSVGKTS